MKPQISYKSLTKQDLGKQISFTYQGNQPKPITRVGKLESIHENRLTLAMSEGGFKSFSFDKIEGSITIE